jgi:hypothetical protein
MHNWQIAGSIFICVAISMANAGTGSDHQIALLDGNLVRESLLHNIVVSFDGNEVMEIRKGNTVIKPMPRTPSLLIFSPSSKAVALNFGNGSGQVYDLTIYDLNSGNEYDIKDFRQSMLAHARKKGCPADMDTMSIVVTRWISDERIKVSTEDFSRLPGCSAMNRSWNVDLRR